MVRLKQNNRWIIGFCSDPTYFKGVIKGDFGKCRLRWGKPYQGNTHEPSQQNNSESEQHEFAYQPPHSCEQ